MEAAQMQRASLGRISGGNSGSASPLPPQTISDRLNNAGQRLENLCNRAEHMLSRVNGTPVGQDANSNKAATAAMPPLLASVDQIENQIGRLEELVNSMERIA